MLFTMLNEPAGTPPKRTALTLLKLIPFIVTTVPALPLFGVNEVILGCG